MLIFSWKSFFIVYALVSASEIEISELGDGIPTNVDESRVVTVTNSFIFPVDIYFIHNSERSMMVRVFIALKVCSYLCQFTLSPGDSTGMNTYVGHTFLVTKAGDSNSIHRVKFPCCQYIIFYLLVSSFLLTLMITRSCFEELLLSPIFKN